jgi:Glyoxalase-like domain
MPTRIDHVIAGALDFRALEAAFVRLGFHVSGGGIHPWGGTRNRVIVLGDGYLELLGIAERAKISHALATRLEATSAGWVGFALQSASIESEVAAMRERGVDVYGPTVGQLVAPSGATRGWHTATVGGEDRWETAEPVPFLIQHHTRGTVHHMELAGAGGLAPHPNGATRLAEVVVAVRDLDTSIQLFERTYGLSAAEGTRQDEWLQATVVTLPLESGEHIVLACPLGAGLAEERIQHAGEGVCGVSIMAELDVALGYLRGHGVAFTQVGRALDIAVQESLGSAVRLVAEP